MGGGGVDILSEKRNKLTGSDYFAITGPDAVLTGVRKDHKARGEQLPRT